MDNDVRWYQDKFWMYWHDEAKTIFMIYYEKSYSWIDYYGMMDVVADMVEDITYPIVYVNVFMKGVQMPAGNPRTHYNNMQSMFSPPFMSFYTEEPAVIEHLHIYGKSSGLIEGEHYVFSDSLEKAIDVARQQVKRLHDQDAESNK